MERKEFFKILAIVAKRGIKRNPVKFLLSVEAYILCSIIFRTIFPNFFDLSIMQRIALSMISYAVAYGVYKKLSQ